MDFIFFEDSWNYGKERHLQQRRTSTACKKENGTEENMLMHIEWINLSMILQWISGCIGENRLARHCP